MGEALNGEPLDGAILVVAQAVIVSGEQVTGQRVVCDLHSQFIVHSEKTNSVYFKYKK